MPSTTRARVLRIDPKDTTAYTVLSASGLDVSHDQVTAMAMDYTTGTMYAPDAALHLGLQCGCGRQPSRLPGYRGPGYR